MPDGAGFRNLVWRNPRSESLGIVQFGIVSKRVLVALPRQPERAIEVVGSTRYVRFR
jgi:hypothetical protein